MPFASYLIKHGTADAFSKISCQTKSLVWSKMDVLHLRSTSEGLLWRNRVLSSQGWACFIDTWSSVQANSWKDEVFVLRHVLKWYCTYMWSSFLFLSNFHGYLQIGNSFRVVFQALWERHLRRLLRACLAPVDSNRENQSYHFIIHSPMF